MLDDALKKAELKLPAPAKRAVLNALSERDEIASVCHGRNGEPEPDPELRDTERVPLTETVEEFFEREVRPHVPDAWIDVSSATLRMGRWALLATRLTLAVTSTGTLHHVHLKT